MHYSCVDFFLLMLESYHVVTFNCQTCLADGSGITPGPSKWNIQTRERKSILFRDLPLYLDISVFLVVSTVVLHPDIETGRQASGQAGGRAGGKAGRRAVAIISARIIETLYWRETDQSGHALAWLRTQNRIVCRYCVSRVCFVSTALGVVSPYFLINVVRMKFC